MKIFNLHVISIFLALVAITTFNWQYGSETFIFFGFAENKEMEIRLEHPVMIKEVHVTPGSKVVKDDLLMEVTRSSLDLTQSDLKYEVAKLNSEFLIWESNLRASIRSLEAQKIAKESSIQSEIEQLESEISINQSLVKDLKSIEASQENSRNSPNKIKIEGLKKELTLTVRPITSQINKLKSELNATQNPMKIQIDKLKQEIGFVDQEEENLKIYATNNGMVGSIFCKIGEQFASFSTLLTFYEENPTQVKAYVLESLILNVQLEDSVIVLSGVQSGSTCMGKVVGMGSRIVEIPARLRQNQNLKTYGREIQIEIPSDNNFLQKEKVVLKIPKRKGPILKILSPPSVTSNPSTVSQSLKNK